MCQPFDIRGMGKRLLGSSSNNEDDSQVAVDGWDLERYSNRQHGKLKLGGFVSEIAYEAAGLAEFLPLLRAGELLHIGGSTSFGLGRYELIESGKIAETSA